SNNCPSSPHPISPPQHAGLQSSPTTNLCWHYSMNTSVPLCAFASLRLCVESSNPNRRATSILLAAASVLALCGIASAADLPPGLVKDQPTTGRFVKTDQGYMVAYDQTIPGTDVKFQMQPIPGGKFLLGSSDTDPGHKPDEAPQ